MQHAVAWLRGDGQIPVPVKMIRTLKPGEFDFYCINWRIYSLLSINNRIKVGLVS